MKASRLYRPLSRAEAVRQNPNFVCPPEILARQELVAVPFFSFEGKIGAGQVVIDRDLVPDITGLFRSMFRNLFPIGSAIPIAHPRFEWDDTASMLANNTSAFNYRHIAGTDRLSSHARGAIDINPLLNPQISGSTVSPPDARYDPRRPGTITADSFIVAFMEERGWTWGGRWKHPFDPQHFEKNLA